MNWKSRKGLKKIKKWIGNKFGEKEGEKEIYTIVLIERSRKDGEFKRKFFPPVPNI